MRAPREGLVKSQPQKPGKVSEWKLISTQVQDWIAIVVYGLYHMWRPCTDLEGWSVLAAELAGGSVRELALAGWSESEQRGGKAEGSASSSELARRRCAEATEVGRVREGAESKANQWFCDRCIECEGETAVGGGV